MTCHYVDSIGYKELPGFLRPENYLKNAEVILEDDYGMIDGIINNGVAEERKPSVLEMLRREDAAKEKELPEFPGAGTKAKKPDERSLS